MLRYYCENCEIYLDENQIDKNTNKCLVCKGKLENLVENSDERLNKEKKTLILKNREKYNNSSVKTISDLYWCEKCNVPSFFEKCNQCQSELTRIGVDLRPVFPEEQLLMDILTEKEYDIVNKSVWYLSSHKYLVDGTVINISRTKLMNKDTAFIRKELEKRKSEIDYDIFNNIVEDFIKVNEKRFSNMVSEASNYIDKISENYSDDEMFISFSGGKDSTVVDHVVNQTLKGRRILKIFGDTTLEFPLTYDYLKRVKADPFNKTYSPVIVSRNRKDDFYELCNKVGPPARLLRWCCTYFKTTPISDKIDLLFKSKKKVLTFYGIRRNESASRSKYDMESDSPKIAKQRAFSPIIDWFDFDIWLYLLSTKIDFNDAYRLGYSRVGCWCCPNNNEWAMFLSDIYMEELSNKWNNILLDFAKKTNKTEPEKYVKDGSWRARQGGNGLAISENSLLNYTPCVAEADTFNYQLTKPITEQLYEFFKPFGNRDKLVGNIRKGEVYFLDKNGLPNIRLQGRIGTSLLKVTILNYKNLGNISKKIRNIQDAQSKIECQLTKYQLCIGCSGCKSVCKFDAISIKPNGTIKNNNGIEIDNIEYKIDENKCVHCGDCIDHYESGCYMKKVLRIKRES